MHACMQRAQTIHLYNLTASSSLAADGSLCIYDADSFVHLKAVSMHKKDVNNLALHPSRKLASTLERNET